MFAQIVSLFAQNTNRSKLDVLQIFCIALFSLSIIAYNSIPGAYIILILILGFCTFVHNVRHSKHPYRLLILTFLAVLLIGATYLFSEKTILIHSAKMLAYLFLCLNIARYYASDSDFLSNLAYRFSQTVIGFMYFITIYIIIYILVFFITTIFGIEIDYFDTLFRCTTAISSFFSLLLILLYEPPKEPYVPGYFFSLLYGKIVPKLSIATGTLAIIYMLQIALGYQADEALSMVYYPYLIVFYGAFLLGLLCNPQGKEQSYLVIIFILLSSVVLFITVIRQFTIPSQQYSSIYAELINLLFIAYNIGLLRAKLLVTKKLYVSTAIVLTLIFCPIIGYESYTTFSTFPGGNLKQVPHYSLSEIFAKNNYYSHWQAYSISTSSTPAKTRPSPEAEDNLFFSGKEQEYTVSIEGYHTLYTELSINKEGPYHYGDVILTPSSDRKTFTLASPQKESQTVAVFDAIKSLKNQSLPPSERAPLVIRTDSYLLVITNYSWQKKGDNPPQYTLRFMLAY